MCHRNRQILHSKIIGDNSAMLFAIKGIIDNCHVHHHVASKGARNNFPCFGEDVTPFKIWFINLNAQM